jgi:transposase
MSNLFWLTQAPMARLQPFFPKSHGKPTGQVSDHTGAVALLCRLPKADRLLALWRGLPESRCWAMDLGYDADWFRGALKVKEIKPCIPGRKLRGKPVKHDKRRYKRPKRREIMFGRLKDWRRGATRYERCPEVVLAVVALAAAVLFWL